MTDFTITMNNEKIWKFYNEHPIANVETTNLFFIELMETSANNQFNTSNSIINTQIVEHLKNIETQMYNLNKKINLMQDELCKNISQISQIKKENECFKKIMNQSETDNIIQEPNNKVIDVLNRWSSSLDKLNR